MKSPFEDLTAALRQRIAVIQDREFYQRDPQGHLSALQEVSERIVSLQAQLPAVDPELKHFLERCSYDKALAWLETHSA